MNDYLISVLVYGTFAEKMKPQLTKDIQILEEFQGDMSIKTATDQIFFSRLGVSVTAEDINQASSLAKKIINDYLAFYSLTTLNHFHIVHDEENPIEIVNLTGDRTPTTKYEPEYGIQDIEGDQFLKNIFIFYGLLQDTKNRYIKNSIEFLFRGRHIHENKVSLVLAIISLEALFSKSSDTGEIGFKLSNRVAVLLGKNSEERKNIRKSINELYNMRSKIVHGVPLQDVDFQGIFIWSRMAILRFLMLAKTYPDHDSIINEIDNAMIDNGSLMELQTKSSELLDLVEKNIHDKTISFRVWMPHFSKENDVE